MKSSTDGLPVARSRAVVSVLEEISIRPHFEFGSPLFRRLYSRSMSFIWACGPPIDMKIRSSRRVYDQSCVDGKGRLHSG
jgi:hypothetical protein